MHRYIPLALLALFGVAFLASPSDESVGTLRHVVAFKFKPEVSADQQAQVVESLLSLEKKIDTIVSIESGTNLSPEGLDKGFTHCFIVTFRTEGDRDAYLVHPDHKKFGSLAGPLLADVFVIDFWAE